MIYVKDECKKESLKKDLKGKIVGVVETLVMEHIVWNVLERINIVVQYQE